MKIDFGRFFTSQRIIIRGSDISITVNGKKVDPKSKEGKKIVAETEKWEKDFEKRMDTFSKKMEQFGKDMEELFK